MVPKPPPVYWSYLEIPLLDIDEPGLLQTPPLNLFFKQTKRPPEYLSALGKNLSPLRQGAVLLDAVVVAEEASVGIEALYPPAGLGAPVSLPEKCRPVLNAPSQVADVDEVKGIFGKCPRL